MIESLLGLHQVYVSVADPLLDIPRIYTAIAEWLACYLYIAFAKKRFAGWKHVALMFVTLGVVVGHQIVAGILPIEFWVPGMILAVTFMFLTIHILSEYNVVKTLYFTIQAFIVAEFVASFEWQIYYYFADTSGNQSELFSILFMIVIYSAMFFVTYLLEKRYRKTRDSIEIKRNDIYSFITIAVAVFAISNFSFLNIYIRLSEENLAEIFYIRTLVDFAGVVLLYSQREHKMSVQLKVEATAMEQLLHKQYEHFQLTQETVDLINRKYHDLKHQIALIKLEEDHELKEKYLEDLESGIILYESNYQTGNRVLDILLAIKSMKCVSMGITLTVVADGNLLNFIAPMDLSAILGNALDNAIENVAEIEEKDKRLIKLAIFKEQNFLMIRIENYFEHQLAFSNGQFMTTKKDKQMHGYGIKSIRSIADKYHGYIKIDTGSQWFKLFIMFPANDQK